MELLNTFKAASRGVGEIATYTLEITLKNTELRCIFTRIRFLVHPKHFAYWIHAQTTSQKWKSMHMTPTQDWVVSDPRRSFKVASGDLEIQVFEIFQNRFPNHAWRVLRFFKIYRNLKIWFWDFHFFAHVARKYPQNFLRASREKVLKTSIYL